MWNCFVKWILILYYNLIVREHLSEIQKHNSQEEQTQCKRKRQLWRGSEWNLMKSFLKARDPVPPCVLVFTGGETLQKIAKRGSNKDWLLASRWTSVFFGWDFAAGITFFFVQTMTQQRDFHTCLNSLFLKQKSWQHLRERPQKDTDSSSSSSLFLLSFS